MSTFDYINRTYGLSLKRGTRFVYTGDVGSLPWTGTVVSAEGHYINVRFDGFAKVVGPFHPTWELRYDYEETLAESMREAGIDAMGDWHP